MQESQKFRVRVWVSCRTSRSSGYGHGSLTELPEVPGIVAQAYRTHRSSERVQNVLYPYPGYCDHGRTELPEVPGTGMNVRQNLLKLFCRVIPGVKIPRVWFVRTLQNTTLEPFVRDRPVRRSVGRSVSWSFLFSPGFVWSLRFFSQPHMHVTCAQRERDSILGVLAACGGLWLRTYDLRNSSSKEIDPYYR